jgi:peptidoglycan/LPS O-acetylase OafA/YrhL
MNDGRIAYRPQLDALRTFAVFSVLISHYWLKESLLGHFGVRLFFVLSGFLITSILLQRGSTWTFYVRRVSRLWPAFYLCLALALLFDMPGYRQSWKWHAAQLTNVYVSLHGTWESAWPAAPLWSLNVEE